MAYPISDVPRRIVYSGSAGVGPYAFTFEVLTSTDIAVYKNSTLLTLTTDYTVSINSGTGTGNVTLVVAATGSDSITIVGDRAIQRASDFVTGGDLFANTLNDELDSLTIYAQQVDEKAGRAIQAPVTDPTTLNMVLPSATSRAGKYLAFSGTGDPIATTGSSSAAPISSVMEPFVAASTLADARTILGISDGAVTTSKIADGAVTTAKWASSNGQLAGMRNKIINGGFDIAQRGTSFTASANNDDAYTLDRWYILSDGNDIVDVTQNSSVVPTNGQYAIALDVETINKKFGIAQIIERANCKGLIGETVTLSFKAKVSSTTKLDNVKAAIVAWSGTADTVTSDIISAWGVEGTNPTLIANATYENTPANLSLTTSYATYSITAAVDTASTNNIIVFIWSDVTDTTLGDFLYITDVQLEPGSTATPFEHRPIGAELALCQRYYVKTYDITIPPANASAAGILATITTSGGLAFVNFVFPVSMRVTPTTVTLYNATTGATGTWRDGGAADRSVTASGAGTSGVYISCSTATGSSSISGHAVAIAEL